MSLSKPANIRKQLDLLDFVNELGDLSPSISFYFRTEKYRSISVCWFFFSQITRSFLAEVLSRIIMWEMISSCLAKTIISNIITSQIHYI